jgi:hypothetical protein
VKQSHIGEAYLACCKACFAGLSPGLPPVRDGVGDGGGGGGQHFGLVPRFLHLSPRSTPNELGLIAEVCFALWPLAVAAEERQHAVHHCLGLRAALLASPGSIAPLVTHLQYVTISNSLWLDGRLAKAAGCLLGICSQGSCCCGHKIKSALNPVAAPLSFLFDCGAARCVSGLGLAIDYQVDSPTSTHARSPTIKPAHEPNALL